MNVSMGLVDDELFNAVLQEVTKHVSPEMLLQHLAASGWTFRRYRRNDHAQEWVLDGDDATAVTVPLPSLPGPNDFTRCMRYAVKHVARLEGWQFLASVDLPAGLREEAGDAAGR